jgi:hypothetical protein
MRGATVVPSLVAVVLLAAAFMSVETARTGSAASALPDWGPYVEAGRTVALALTTIDYRTVDRDVAHVLDNATAGFYDNFKSRSAEFTQVVLNAKSISTGTVTQARMDSANAGQGRVFVVVAVATVNEGQPPQPTRDWRLMITVQKLGDVYKASSVEFLK